MHSFEGATNKQNTLTQMPKAGTISRRRKAIKCVEHNKLQNETNNQPETNEYEWREEARGRALLNKD